MTLPDPALTRERMIECQIRSRGVTDVRVLDALRAVPREEFIPPEFKQLAYDDRALPIGHDQTISQPFIVAYMTQQLRVESTSRVLEIGTGSGYQAAVLARLAAHVYTIERIRELQTAAMDTFRRLGIANASFHAGDGTLGWPDEAPFDRILITAGAPRVPPALLDQLGPSGVLVAPIGGMQNQQVVRFERLNDRLFETPLIGCRFVKLLGEEGWKA